MRVAHRLRPDEPNDFTVDKADALVAFWRELTQILFTVIPAVVCIGIVVGGIVIMNIMLMTVTERTREIGTPQVARRHTPRHPAAVPGRVGRPLDRSAASSASSAGGCLAVLVSTFTPLPARVTALVGRRGAGARRRNRDHLRRLPRHRAPRGSIRSPLCGPSSACFDPNVGEGVIDRARRRCASNKLRSGADHPRRGHRRDHGHGDGLDGAGHPHPDLQRHRDRRPHGVLRHAVLLADAAQSRPTCPTRCASGPCSPASDAEAIARMPEIRLRRACGSSSFSGSSTRGPGPRRSRYLGADDHFMDIQGGTLLRGRFFTRGELAGERGCS